MDYRDKTKTFSIKPIDDQDIKYKMEDQNS